MYAKVLIEYKVKSLDRTFTYKVPEHLEDIIKKGMKVIVPFGNSDKTINGLYPKSPGTLSGLVLAWIIIEILAIKIISNKHIKNIFNTFFKTCITIIPLMYNST